MNNTNDLIPHAGLGKFLQDPRCLLLLDLLGALMTSLSTALLLATGWWPAGIPSSILFVMAAAALGFACFDAVGLLLIPSPKIPLAVIAVLNLLYCASSLVICCIFARNLTLLGMIYFSIEAIIVVPLAWWEWRIARRGITFVRGRTRAVRFF